MEGNTSGAGSAILISRGRDRRLINNRHGRRAGDRRACVGPVDPQGRPPIAPELVAAITFVEAPPRDPHAERDLEGARAAIRFQAGEPDAFEQIYRLYFTHVHHYLCTFLGDEVEAEDAAQHVFMKVLNGLPTYELRRGRFGGWVFAIARNLAVDILRRRRPHPTDPVIVNALRRDDERRVPRHPDPIEYDLDQLVRSLPALQRKIVFLRYTLGFSNGEVAELLGRSPDSISGIHYRALAALEQALAAANHPSARKRPQLRTRRVPKLHLAA